MFQDARRRLFGEKMGMTALLARRLPDPVHCGPADLGTWPSEPDQPQAAYATLHTWTTLCDSIIDGQNFLVSLAFHNSSIAWMNVVD